MKRFINVLVLLATLFLSFHAFHARADYDPTIQRWIEMDPIGEAGGVNLYQFVGNSPPNLIDPYGLWWWDRGLIQIGGPQLLHDIFMGDRPAPVVDPNSLLAQHGVDLTVTGGQLPGNFVASQAGEVVKNSLLTASMITPIGPLGEGEGAYASAAKALEAARLAKAAKAARCAKSLLDANPVGSALKADKYHRAATFMREAAAQSGTHFDIVGADGITRTLTQVPGTLDGIAGRFEYIVDQVGNLTHQLFVPKGTINGVPIVP